MADTVMMPKLGFDMAEGTLVRWVIQEGEQAAKGAVLAEIETDKATVEVESNFEGVVLRHLVAQGDVVPVNAPIALIGQPGEQVEAEVAVEPDEAPVPVKADAPTVQPAAAQPPAEKQPAEIAELPEGRRASPLARRMAADHGVDLRQVTGSGPEGRIVKRDVQAVLESAPAAPQAAPTRQPFASAEDRRIPLSKLRTIIARRMVESTQQAPHFYVTHEFDMAALMGARKQINDLLPEEEKISVNDFIVRAAALALLEFPNLNASIDLAKEEIIQRGQINVGVAVAVENGLLTVVCRDTVNLSLRQISAEMGDLVKRARDGKVRPDDIEGSTFTISNLGMFDVDQFTAIINSPEAAILAVGSVRQVPVVVDGEIRPGTRMKATLSVDHRVSDGAEAARFLQALARHLENPLLLLI